MKSENKQIELPDQYFQADMHSLQKSQEAGDSPFLLLKIFGFKTENKEKLYQKRDN